MELLNEFKHFLQIDLSDASKDDLLNELLDRAEAAIAKIFGGELEYTQYTDEYYDYSSLLFPIHYPIISVESLTINENPLIENEDFYVYDNYIKIIGHESDASKCVKLSYTAGFDFVPDDIIQAIILQAAFYLKLNVDLQPQQLIDGRLTEEIEDLLRPYLRIII